MSFTLNTKLGILLINPDPTRVLLSYFLLRPKPVQYLLKQTSKEVEMLVANLLGQSHLSSDVWNFRYIHNESHLSLSAKTPSNVLVGLWDCRAVEIS